MRTSHILLAAAAFTLAAGCAGPERKFGRGLNNLTEVTRLGDMSRAVEQTALWDGPSLAPTTGFIRGLNRTVVRTGIGLYEVVTAPLPPYGPLLTSTNRIYPDATVRNRKYPWGGMVLTENPTFPDSYRPGFFEDSIFATDSALGFSGGDVAPMFPGSRFRIFDP